MSTLDGKIMDIFQSLFGWIWTVLLGPFQSLKGFRELIFGTNTNGTHLAFGIFPDNEITNIYTPGKNVFLAIAIMAMLVGIVLAGMKISSTGINPSNRTYVIEFFKDLAIVSILLFNLDTLYQVIFTVNYSIVNAFSGVSKELITLSSTIDNSHGVLGNLIINLVLLGLAIWANFYYMMRRLTLLLLMILGPVMVALYLIPQTKGITMGWLKELIGTVMVQSVHAALYWMIALMSLSTSGIEGIILYVIFIPVSESLRALLGLGGQINDRFSRSAYMFGGAALAGMYGSIKGAIGGKSVTETLRKATGSAINVVKGKNGEGEGNKKAVPNATDTGSTSWAERMLKAGEFVSKGGKAVFGMAGAIVGSPMGSIAASTVGFNAGGIAGGVAGRAGMALGEGAVRRLAAGEKKAYNKAKGIKNGEKLADEKLAKAIAEDETTQWANANQEGFLKDLKERFPDAADASLNKMWNDKVSAKRGEFLENARGTVGQIKENNGQHAKASELVDSTVDSLTNDWAKDNKAQFMKNYDAKNPLPANASEADIVKHNKSKESAWQNEVAGKKQAISNVASKTAARFGNQATTNRSNINKDDFVNEVSAELGSVIGTSGATTIAAVKKATQSVKSSNQKENGNELINASVENLTNDWAKNNKAQFMKEFDAKNPLPVNASETDRTNHNKNKESSWQNAVAGKKEAIGNVARKTAAKLGYHEPNDFTSLDKDDFVNGVCSQLGSVIGTTGSATVAAVKKATRSVKATYNKANANELVNTAVDHLTNDWANNNKSQFMKEYDNQNPLPANASKQEMQRHNQNRESAWQSAVTGKREAIRSVVSQGAAKLSSNVPADISYISKVEFANQVSKEVGSIIGVSGREATISVKGATSSVKTASLYSGKSVNREYLANQLAGIRTESGKQDFVAQTVKNGNGKVSEQDALQQWNNVEAPKRFQQNFSKISQTMPRHIPLDHAVNGNKAGRAVRAVGKVAWAGVVGATGFKEISQFMMDTKMAQLGMGAVEGYKNAPKFDMSQGVIHGTTSGVVGVAKSIGSTAVSNFKNHVPSNVIEKQAAFKNGTAYIGGIVGGVTGYKEGASFAAGGPSVLSRERGSLSIGFNPYNNAVNKQISEVSDIAHMVQTVKGPSGEMIPNGAIRMVTTDRQTVIQVRDKTGNVQTVSRIASGDASLKKGQTIYQDLTIQSGQLAPSSNVYQEDSGGGRIAVNRSINVDPNRIVANCNTPKNPRVVQEVQSYNQNVDSGQYYMKDAIQEMTNIHMVVDRNRSYMVGTKGGQEYRISQYGFGDARLGTEEVVYRKCEVRNRKLVTTTAHKNSLESEEFEYTNSTRPENLSPDKLMPKMAPNKRNANRQQLEKFRNKSFVESLR